MDEFNLQSSETLNHGNGMFRRFVSAIERLPRPARTLYVLAILVFIVTSLAMLVHTANRYMIEVPRHGGSLAEGIIGRPRFINPVIAKSDADRDMSILIYSGLMKATPEGALVTDLASDYTISDDGLTYTFTLRDGLVWHDGEPITSADIAFTIEKVRDQGLAIKSPRRASWEGVDVATPDDRTVVFTLKQPYAPFLENTTMGIIPKHIWEKVPDEEFDVSYFNIEPIGSGPYRMGSVVRDNAKGLPRYYDLVAFKSYAGGEPYISHLRMQFFGNNQELAQAYSDHTIDQIHTIEPENAQVMERSGAKIIHAPLPRIFAAFFNQNQQPIFTDVLVRKALATAVDKDRIVNEVLFGYGKTINGPLPFLENSTDTVATTTDRATEAREILENAGWQLNAANVYEKTDKKKKTVSLLEFSIAVPDVPELRQAADLLKKDWENAGASVEVKVYDPATFSTDVLAPRKYDVLFYGEINGRVPDPYAYWHSSQRNSPGLNVALYANKNVDKILENARKEEDEVARTLLFQQFTGEIDKDVPAVFIYSPDFLYAVSPRVYGINVGLITTESERFLGVGLWYMESERVWKWFAK